MRPYLAGIEDKVSMGAINSPGSVTLAGDETELARLLGIFETKQIFARYAQCRGALSLTRHGRDQ